MHVNAGVQCPGGPHFEVAPGITLVAHTFDLLYPQITEYRLRAGIPAGDVVGDVDRYICSRWPMFCQPDGKDGPTPEMRRDGISGRVANSAALLIRAMPPGGYDLVEEAEARRRETICLGCPYKVAWRSYCSPCNSSTDAILTSVRRLRKIDFDNSILACEVCGHDNATAAWLPLAAVTPKPEIVERLAPGCWIRQNNNAPS